MLDLGITKPPHIPGLSSYSSGIDSTSWTALDIPTGTDGRKPKYVLLSWNTTGTFWFLLLGLDPTGSGSAPSDLTQVIYLDGYQHNPILLNVTGIDRLWIRSDTGSSLAVRISPLGNASPGHYVSPLKTPLQIAADSVSASVSTGGVSITLPNNSRGEVPKFVLLTWDDWSIPLRLTKDTFSAGSQVLWIEMNPCVLNVTGWVRIRVRTFSGTVRVYITPLENS